MKNLYNEFFQVPEKGKIREKVLFAHITVTVVSIIICLIAMSVTAYAYFTSTVSSGTNLVKTAKYTLSVSAVNKDTDQPVTFTLDGNNYSAPLEAGTYVFTLTPTGTATNGFSVVEINGDTYHTVQIENTPFTFEIVFENYSVIEFIPHWGTSSHYDAYKNGDTDPYYIEKNITVKTTAASAPLTEPTPTATPTPTPEITPEIAPEATATSTPEVTATPTVAPSTATPTATPILTPEVTPTLAPEVTPTLTPEATPTATAVPTATAEPTLTPASEATPTPTPEDITE